MRTESRKLALVCFLGLDLILRLAVAVRPLDTLDGVTIPDDAYLSLHLARSIARGEGPFYETGHTNGFQPLYVYLAAPALGAVGGEPVAGARAALVLLAFCDVTALALLWRRVSRDTRSAWSPACVALAWIFGSYPAQTTANGLETTLAFATLVLTFDTLRAIETAQPGRARSTRLFGLGAALGLAALARIDALVAAPVIAWRLARLEPRAAAPGCAGGARANGGAAAAVRALALVAAGALLVYAPWLIESWRRTGSILPVSGAAVHELAVSEFGGAVPPLSHFVTMAHRAANGILRKHLVAYVVLAIAALGVLTVFPPGRRRAWFARFGALSSEAAFVVILVASYVFFVFGSWYFERYLFPVTVVTLLALGPAVDGWVDALSVAGAAATSSPRADTVATSPALAALARHRRVLAAGLVAFVIAGGVAQPGFRKCYFSTRAEALPLGYMNAGLWVRARLPAGTRLGAQQSGAIGYFADSLVVVNLDGVVNARALAALRERRELEYIRAEGVGWLFCWRDDLDFIRDHSRDWRDGDIEPVEEARGFASWGERWTLCRVRPAPPR